MAELVFSPGGLMSTISVGSPYVVNAGITVTSPINVGSSPGTSVHIVDIEGRLTISGGLTGIQATGGDKADDIFIGKTGVLTVDGPYGYYAQEHGPSFHNEGLVNITGSVTTGVSSSVTDSSFRNDGAFTVYGTEYSWGFKLDDAPHLFNSGTINVSAGSSAHGLEITGGLGELVNETTGTIRVSDTSPGVSTDDGRNSVALYLNATPTGAAPLLNQGWIQGDIALKVTVVDPLHAPAELMTFTNDATGTMVGEIDLSAVADQLVNHGLIIGAVNLGAGDDVYLGAGGGRTVGLISGGEGNDHLVGGDGFDNLQGNQGDDRIEGGDSDDWVVGGKDNDSLSGQGGQDIVYGNIGADTCDGGDGADLVRGGQGDDVIVGGAGDDWLSGDLGADTLTGGAGADVFHSFGLAEVDRVTDFNVDEGDRIQLDGSTGYVIAQQGADTVITLNGVGQLILVGVQMSSLHSDTIFYG